jgi:hypothetical protein
MTSRPLFPCQGLVNAQEHLEVLPAGMLPQWRSVSWSEMNNNAGCQGLPHLVNSHVYPKRMGDQILRIVYSKFVSASPPPTLSIFDTICGITLSASLDALFEEYELGLRLVALVRSSFFLIFYR